MKFNFYPSISGRPWYAPLLLLMVSLGLAGRSSAQAPYCTITYANQCTTWGVNQVTIGTFTHSPACNSTTKYQDYTTQNIPITAGVATNVSLSSLGYCGVGLAVDFNNDNDFEDAGELLFTPNYDASASTIAYTGSITIPPSVAAGNYRLRIWGRGGNSGGPNNGLVPCGTGYGYGRYMDYKLVVTNAATCLPPSNIASVPTSNSAAISWTASTSSPANYRWLVVADGANPNTAPAVATGTTTGTSVNATGLASSTPYDAYVKSLCSASDSSAWNLVNDFTTLCGGNPGVGVASSSVATVCPTISFNLILTGITAAPGITYKWQSAAAVAGPFADIAGGTTTTFATTQSAATYYRCIVKCTGTGDSTISNVINVALTAPSSCYCIPTSTTPASYYISSFSTTGGTTNITNNGTGSASYNDYSATMSASAPLGGTVNFSLTTSSSLSSRAIYIDWNKDGAFDEVTEKVYSGIYSAVATATVTGSFMVPWSATVGATRMRVRNTYYGNTMNSCGNIQYGEAEDYTFNVLSVSGVCVNPINLTTSGITFTGATVNYAAPPVGNTPTSYIYELRLDGTAPGSGATGLAANGTTAAFSVPFTNLYQGTQYSFYARTFCSVGDTSSWTSVSFTTLTDTLTPVSLNGLAFDVIANGIGNASASTNNDVDGAGYALVSADFQATSSSAFPTQSIPVSRIIQNTFRKYRLNPYSANNSLRLTGTNSGTVRFLAPKRANKVYVMGVSGSGASTHTATVYFNDGTTQTATQGYPDWFASGNNVASTVGRITISSNALGTGGPYLHDSAITILTANRNKQIDSISFAHSGTGVMNILAVSVVPNTKQTCPLPGMPTASNVTCAGGTLTWTGNGTNTNYQVSYGPAGYYANNGTIVPITGSTGVNTYVFPYMGPNVNYQLYVRTNCGSGSFSDWVGPVDVAIPNIQITPTFTLPQTLCSGATAPTLPTTSTNNITGTWNPSTVSNTTSGTYVFTPAPNQCAVNVTQNITVSGLITPTFTAVAPLCNGTTAPLLPTTSNNGITGVWVPSTISNTASGSYTFTPTSGASCNTTATMSVTVLPTSQHTETLEICSEELPYTWNGQSVATGGQGIATYVTPSANGCDSTVTLNLNVTASSDPSIFITRNPSGTIYSGVTTTFTALVTDGGSNPLVKWRKNGIDIPGATAATWSGVAGTDFYHGDEISAYASNFNFCAANQTVYSNALMMSINPNGIKNVPNRPGFKMYPNPAQTLINIEGLIKGDHYRLYDALGRMLAEGETDGSKTLQIDLSAFAQGMYIIKFNNNNGQVWQQKVQKL
ncbi:GEVED domain-containing protein [Edaphocola aurantiacus]|uniref:GEVED domain-containing protein n=1 Tax=Edaphocola aurantiacus TaxID=2601682 RepID=UPI001C95AFB0|nr:GEVED domain-containing protein [Edaphocola aurantiacus]